MSTLHLVKSYCLTALLYGCEVWHLNDSNMQKISVAWNNCFRRIFSWERKRKTTAIFLSHTANIILVTPAQIAKLYCSESVVLQSLSRRMHQAFIAVSRFYNVLSPKLPNNSVTELIWNSFATFMDL